MSSPRFVKTIGYALDPASMPTEEAGLLIQAVHVLSKDSACTAPELAIQQLKWRLHQGQITAVQLTDSADYADICSAAIVNVDLEALVAVVKPIIQHALHKDAVEAAISDFGKGVPVEKAAHEFSKIAAVGERSVSLGHEGLGLAADILEAANSTLIDPIPTGILELDNILHGGLEKHALGLILGGSGDGKSLMLSSILSESVYGSMDCAYITLEMGEAAVRQRIYANLLDMTPSQMKDDPQEAEMRYQMLMKRPNGLGRWVVNYMSPRATTAGDIRAWLADLEQERSFKPKLLIIDYADHMCAQMGKEQKSYLEMRDVYTGLRKIVAEDKLVDYMWTASQTKESDRKKRTNLDSASDSKWKIRTADVVVAIERTEDDCANDLIRFRVPKRRNAEAHGEVGPIQMDAQRWRIVAMNRSNPW